MKIKTLALSLVALISLCVPSQSSAINLKDLVKKNSGVVGDLIEGVLTRSNIEVSDMVGTWKIEGSAVSFKSDNALAKAGGIAAASVVQNKIDPYFEKYGFTGGELTITEDGSFSLSIKKITLSGTVTKKGDDGTFDFQFKALGIPLTSMTAYVEKSPSNLKIMFDATKLKNLLQSVGKLVGSNLAKTAVSLLDSYDGLCVGFSMESIGEAPASTTSSSSLIPSILNSIGGSDKTNSNPDSTPNENSNSGTDTTVNKSSNPIGSLINILGGSKKK